MNKLNRCRITSVLALVIFSTLQASVVPDSTEIQYLSGKGCDDTVDWEFYCTGGRRAGEWTTIQVPSNWELQGFGGYNYGHDRPKLDEQGKYRTRFKLDSSWATKRVLLVFGGVMTDTQVWVNGRSAGPIHQGGFYEFEYDITDLVKCEGDNLLEVTVSKVSADKSVEAAERQADYWVFGGIYRPVWLAAVPQTSIDWTAVDARADGLFMMDVHLRGVVEEGQIAARIIDDTNLSLGSEFVTKVAAGAETVRIQTQVVNQQNWTAETPHLYTVALELRQDGKTVHNIRERFGFRTFEVRPGEGLYLNGSRIMLKGVCRHSFWPDTGRCLSEKICYDDVRLIKSMNMNAVRMSHYPPDRDFLRACDELGLYVLDELAGWQKPPYDTGIGRKLVAEMVRRDVNHPCILFWDNANEGGWNKELDREFALYDPQNRPVLHPWESSSGVNTAHYRSYDQHKTLAEGKLVRQSGQEYRQGDLYMPTEFLHGLYDGGHGAGLNDFWQATKQSKLGVGGFLWALVDEGVIRTDKDGIYDNDGNHAPDGIVGPHRQKEGSFYTIKEIWSPVQIDLEVIGDDFSGHIPVSNDYSFTNLRQCEFTWSWIDFGGPFDDKSVVIRQTDKQAGPDVEPGSKGELTINLPEGWRGRDALRLTARGPGGEELWTWTWAMGDLTIDVKDRVAKGGSRPVARIDGNRLVVTNDEARFEFDRTNGRLMSVEREGQAMAFGNGPRFVPDGDVANPTIPIVSARADRAESGNGAANTIDGQLGTRWSAEGDGVMIVFDLGRVKAIPEVAISWQKGNARQARFELAVSADGQNWQEVYRGQSSGQTDQLEHYRLDTVSGRYIRLTGRGNTENNWTSIQEFQVVDHESAPDRQGPEVKYGKEGADYVIECKGKDHQFTWTVYPSGWLGLSWEMELEGAYDTFGITFDCPEDQMAGKTWLGAGPYRVWKNRLRGTSLGVWHMDYNDPIPGQTYAVPEFKGYFANLNWLKLDTHTGVITAVADHDLADTLYFRVGKPQFGINPSNTQVAFPEGEVSFLHAIPPIGTKFKPADQLGPESQKNVAQGRYRGQLYFNFGKR